MCSGGGGNPVTVSLRVKSQDHCREGGAGPLSQIIGDELREGDQHKYCLFPQSKADTRRHQQGKASLLSSLIKEKGSAKGEADKDPTGGWLIHYSAPERRAEGTCVRREQRTN
ncbi:hypothetical protein DR999_PMT16636 [Platysternon megacephalum]|uniref:Uncharacterized protein n=1 Tax=Platysternon megacephalum TaxID=55544 RepID=A0A4D9DYI3_9SAUR|nr:hypothetical protein DR999_PMT16636 [Platysternon megacephalum]